MNREQLKYDKIWRWSFAALLVALLTLSPCSIRNAIEQSFGLEKSFAVNKIKSTEVKSATCITADAPEDIIPSNTTSLFFLSSFSESLVTLHFFNPAEDAWNYSPTATLNGGLKIPFYILYHNFKFHL